MKILYTLYHGIATALRNVESIDECLGIIMESSERASIMTRATSGLSFSHIVRKIIRRSFVSTVFIAVLSDIAGSLISFISSEENDTETVSLSPALYIAIIGVSALLATAESYEKEKFNGPVIEGVESDSDSDSDSDGEQKESGQGKNPEQGTQKTQKAPKTQKKNGHPRRKDFFYISQKVY